MLKTEHVEWIDVCKGIGILTVVVGHAWTAPHTYIFWFHIPLFFFISGYLYKPGRPAGSLLRKKAYHLLLPYLSFLLLITVLGYAKDVALWLHQGGDPPFSDWIRALGYKLWGGRYVGAFWFVTCLFFTQQVYNVLHRWTMRKAYLLHGLVLFAYAVAMLESRYLSAKSFPWSIDIVAMALPFYHLGHIASQTKVKMVLVTVFSAIIVAGAVVVDRENLLNLEFDMYLARYGVPLVSVVLAVACIALVCQLSKAMCSVPFLRPVFSTLGGASMVIMFLHQFVQTHLDAVPFGKSVPAVIALSLLLPLAAYRLFILFPITRKVFLGEASRAGKTPLTASMPAG